MKAPKSWLKQFIYLQGMADAEFARLMTFAGNKVDSYQKVHHDTVFDFEITSNRPDTLSLTGLAREAAAVLKRPLKLPQIPRLPTLKTNPRPLKVEDQKLCPTYSLVELAGVRVKQASKLIQSRLKLSGIEPVNNVVDITNYLMLETGQPMHAFDVETILGDLTLRAAKAKETITTLDHKLRQLKGGEIVIGDEKKLIDLAGLIGGLNSEISLKTKRVLLLIPIYDPVSIRRASKNLGLRSEASLRFEKKLDLTQTPTVAARAVKMFEAETHGLPATKLISHQVSFKPPTIRLETKKVNQLIGISLTPQKIDAYLKSLSFKKSAQGYTPPPWRRDVQEPVDLIEEIARLHGFNHLPKTLPTGTIPAHQDALAPNWGRKVRHIAASLGFTETYSYTLISQDTITALGLKPQSHLKVLYPMSRDYEYMRSSLMENLIPSLVFNLRHFQNVNLFELGTVFYPQKSISRLPDQPTELGLIATPTDFRQFKGILESLLKSLNLEVSLRIQKLKQPYFHPQNQAAIFHKASLVGFIGEIKATILPQGTPKAFGLALNIEKLLTHMSRHYRYPPMHLYPPIIEDYTFILPPKTPVGHVIDDILATSKFVEKVTLKEIYGQNYTFTVHFRDAEKSLTDKAVAPIRKKIVANLQKHFSAKLQGTIL